MNGEWVKAGREEKSSTFCKFAIHGVQDFSLVPRFDDILLLIFYLCH